MNAKFTPGPWRFVEVFINNQPNSFMVCTGKPFRGQQTVADCGPKGEANARLIAAAPELLEALKIAREGLSPMQRDTDLGKQIDKAIAKAEVK